jgi:hypothetical protein
MPTPTAVITSSTPALRRRKRQSRKIKLTALQNVRVQLFDELPNDDQERLLSRISDILEEYRMTVQNAEEEAYMDVCNEISDFARVNGIDVLLGALAQTDSGEYIVSQVDLEKVGREIERQETESYDTNLPNKLSTCKSETLARAAALAEGATVNEYGMVNFTHEALMHAFEGLYNPATETLEPLPWIKRTESLKAKAKAED